MNSTFCSLLAGARTLSDGQVEALVRELDTCADEEWADAILWLATARPKLAASELRRRTFRWSDDVAAAVKQLLDCGYLSVNDVHRLGRPQRSGSPYEYDEQVGF